MKLAQRKSKLIRGGDVLETVRMLYSNQDITLHVVEHPNSPTMCLLHSPETRRHPEQLTKEVTWHLTNRELPPHCGQYIPTFSKHLKPNMQITEGDDTVVFVLIDPKVRKFSVPPYMLQHDPSLTGQDLIDELGIGVDENDVLTTVQVVLSSKEVADIASNLWGLTDIRLRTRTRRSSPLGDVRNHLIITGVNSRGVLSYTMERPNVDPMQLTCELQNTDFDRAVIVHLEQNTLFDFASDPQPYILDKPSGEDIPLSEDVLLYGLDIFGFSTYSRADVPDEGLVHSTHHPFLPFF